jgi:hypothetical protein
MLLIGGIVIFWCISSFLAEVWAILRWPLIVGFVVWLPFHLHENHSYPAMTKAEAFENVSVVRLMNSRTDEYGNNFSTFAISNNHQTLTAPAAGMVIGCPASGSVVLMSGTYHGKYVVDEDRAIPPSTIVIIDFRNGTFYGHDVREAYGEVLSDQDCVVGPNASQSEILKMMTRH